MNVQDLCNLTNINKMILHIFKMKMIGNLLEISINYPISFTDIARVIEKGEQRKATHF